MVSMQQQKILAICPKVPAVLSMLCSGYIVYSVLSDHRKRAVAKERMLLGMSISDIIFSFCWFLSTWPIPRGTANLYGAIGNTQTCTMQGFFIQLGIMTPMYNGFFALYCFLYVCMDWGKQWMKHTEVFGHIVIIAFGFSTAIAGIPLEVYNNSMTHCFIAPLPFNCTQRVPSRDGTTMTTTDCIRGDDAVIYRWAFSYGVIWFNIFLTFICMTLVYISIRKQEKKMEAYTSNYSENNNSRKSNNSSDSRAFAVRGALYTGSFFLTWVPSTVAASFFTAGTLLDFGHGRHLALGIITITLTPSQGIFNFFIYIWPAVSRHLKEEGIKRTSDKLLENEQARDDERNAIKNEDHSDKVKEER